MPIKTILGVLVTATLLALIPLVLMQFNAEMDWGPFDFAVAWVLFAGAGFAYALVSQQSRTIMYRAAVGLSAVTALFLMWANLAVGLIGSEDNPANLLYGAVFAVGFLGSILVGFKARGMMYTLFAVAATQLLVPVVAFFIWKPDVTIETAAVFGVNAFFCVLWLGSALLFRRAAIA